MTVGILGMAFKGESDDIRSSLSYKLQAHPASSRRSEVLCTDPYVTVDPDAAAARDGARARPTSSIVGAPHAAYRDLPTDMPVVDIWNLLGRGVRV